MHRRTTLAASVTAAFFASALFAQGQTAGSYYTYSAPQSAAPASCTAQTRVSVEDALTNAGNAFKAKPPQLPQAKCWLEVAAAQDNAAAYGGLAAIYFKGFGVPVDLPKALGLAMRAAKGGDTTGDLVISQMYETGQGMPKSPAEAKFWKDKVAQDEASFNERVAAMKKEQVSGPDAAARPPYGPNGPQPGDERIAIPKEMHFRAQHSLTFTLESDGSLHNRTNLGATRNSHRVLSIEKFTPDSVIIHRTDYGDFPRSETMTGHMGPGYNTAVGQGWALSWGDALNELPANDAEAAQLMGTSPQQQMAEDNIYMLFRLFGALGSSPAPEPKKSGIGCAPGVVNYNCGR
jgi:hypothetical protein